MAEGVAKLTDKDFDAQVTQSKGVVVVDFAAGWCPPCKILSPIIAQVSADVAGKAKVFSLDVEDAPRASATFGVMNVPTLIFFKDGKEAMRVVGLGPISPNPRERIIERIDSLAK